MLSPKVSELATQWVKQYAADMVQWASQRLPDRQTAEDLVQDVFVVACQKWERFEGKSEVRTWLYGILKNKIADHFRAAYRLKTNDLKTQTYFDGNDVWLPDEKPAAWPANDIHLLDDEAFRAVFTSCLEKLPPRWHHTILLKYIDERASAEICKEMGLSTTNYWQMIHRAKLQLRKCLQDNWFTI